MGKNSIVGPILLVGGIGFAILAYMNRCEWFNMCDGQQQPQTAAAQTPDTTTTPTKTTSNKKSKKKVSKHHTKTSSATPKGVDTSSLTQNAIDVASGKSGATPNITSNFTRIAI